MSWPALSIGGDGGKRRALGRLRLRHIPVRIVPEPVAAGHAAEGVEHAVQDLPKRRQPRVDRHAADGIAHQFRALRRALEGFRLQGVLGHLGVGRRQLRGRLHPRTRGRPAAFRSWALSLHRETLRVLDSAQRGGGARRDRSSQAWSSPRPQAWP